MSGAESSTLLGISEMLALDGTHTNQARHCRVANSKCSELDSDALSVCLANYTPYRCASRTTLRTSIPSSFILATLNSSSVRSLRS